MAISSAVNLTVNSKRFQQLTVGAPQAVGIHQPQGAHEFAHWSRCQGVPAPSTYPRARRRRGD